MAVTQTKENIRNVLQESGEYCRVEESIQSLEKNTRILNTQSCGMRIGIKHQLELSGKQILYVRHYIELNVFSIPM